MGVSLEMKDDLAGHMEANLNKQLEGGYSDLWHDELNSQLARPLDATVFCSRDLQVKDRQGVWPPRQAAHIM